MVGKRGGGNRLCQRFILRQWVRPKQLWDTNPQTQPGGLNRQMGKDPSLRNWPNCPSWLSMGVWMERWRGMENARHRPQRCRSVGQWGKEKKFVPETLTPIEAVGSGRGVKMGAQA